jgi:formate dehydrogenase subunit gamma
VADKGSDAGSPAPAAAAHAGNGPSLSGRVTRHKGPDRLFHWLNAVAVLTLLATSFLPIAGIKFDWLMIHWIAGLALTALVLFHIVRALVWQDRGSMWFGRADFKGAVQGVRWGARLSSEPPPPPGKYPLPQKLFHLGMALVILTALVTGLMMLAKIDTPFWGRDPYILSAKTWGIVYVLHGLAAMAVLAMVVVHVYFAVRPEKLWITRSMIAGWITRKEYKAHFDPKLWRAGGEADGP